MTHWDGSSDEACKIYSLMIHYLITEAEKLGGDPGRLRKHLDVLLRPTKYNTYNTDNLLRLGGSGGLESSGYVVDSFKFCPWDSVGYADAICNAANMGGTPTPLQPSAAVWPAPCTGFQAIPQECGICSICTRQRASGRRCGGRCGKPRK